VTVPEQTKLSYVSSFLFDVSNSGSDIQQAGLRRHILRGVLDHSVIDLGGEEVAKRSGECEQLNCPT
jgi:hypothetical protein